MAISTTGDEHRLPLLVQCVRAWDQALNQYPGSPMFVTVDGDGAAVARVAEAVYEWTGSVFRVGQPGPDYKTFNHRLLAPVPRLGVATNKNTGIELLMDSARDVEHLFLSDDDTWPLFAASLDKHIDLNNAHDIRHSMVCWGANRLESVGPYATWKWPRGVMIYTRRNVIETVGGMVEAFGPGGHEHVEWSQRIHNAGLTPAPFCSPLVYAEMGTSGRATRASTLWHCEDMRRPGEKLGDHLKRKRGLTSVRRTDDDWEHITRVMQAQAGSSAFIPYQASYNGRVSATLYPPLSEDRPRQGAGGDK